MLLDSVMFLILVAGFLLTAMYVSAEFRVWRSGNAARFRRQSP
jgi:hypothetical protein